jgi:hypothetical protein
MVIFHTEFLQNCAESMAVDSFMPVVVVGLVTQLVCTKLMLSEQRFVHNSYTKFNLKKSSWFNCWTQASRKLGGPVDNST